MPEMPKKEAESDFYFVDRTEAEQNASTVLEMVKALTSNRKQGRPVEKSAGRFHASVTVEKLILFPIGKFEMRSWRH